MFLRKKLSHQHQQNECEGHDAKVSELRNALGPLTGRSLKYCTDECLRRYLKARNWNVDKAKKMLDETRKWRSTYKPEETRWISNNTADDIRLLVYLIENGIINLAEGKEQMSWLIDFSNWSLSTKVSIKTSRDCINVLQNHYPERLAVSFLYNPPRIFEAFWKIVKYFLDPITFQKVKFVYPKNKESIELMKSYFDIDNLPAEFGGKSTMKYDHEEFSQMMLEDDIKTAKFWGLDEKLSHVCNSHLGAQVAPEPKPLAPAPS